MILVIGGASSGKSTLAERICQSLGRRLVYIATMVPGDGPETAARIARHCAARAGKGFSTLECYRDLNKISLEPHCEAVLLECLGNVVANELFAEHTSPDHLVETVMEGLSNLERQVPELVVVSNDVFAGAETYTGAMADYLLCLGNLNRAVALSADIVVESVCGLPVWHKGESIV